MGDDTKFCPFCPFSDSDANFVAQHIEFCHPEDDDPIPLPDESHFMNSTSSTQPINKDATAEYVDCPHGCGETVLATELSIHLDLHVAEGVALDEDESAPSPFHADDLATSEHEISTDYDEPVDLPGSRKGGKRSVGRDLAQPKSGKPGRARSPPGTIGPDGAKRLGRSELGPHAHEKKMPSWLRKMLEKGGRTTKQTKISADGKLVRHTTTENETDHLIPVIAKLCEQDTSVQRAFLCSPTVRHICKMPREGGFCGYRNIQMLVSYLKKTQSYGHEHFPDGIPTILDLQDRIELAWDMGFNSTGRTETGGIKDTRKFIGTPEAQALFMSIGIPCDASSLSDSGKLRAHDTLYMEVAGYFRSSCSLEDEETKVFTTDLAPIYFQHQGHSMTIIGFEIRDNGTANLLVFDPMYKTSPAMHRLIGTSARSEHPHRLLKAYRRGTPYLQKHRLFELLKLSAASSSSQSTEAEGKT